MMTDCLHYKDYAPDAIKLVVEKLELEGEEVDGKKVVKGPMWKRGPGPPATLRRHWMNVSHDQRSKVKQSKTNHLGCARRPVHATA